MSMPDDPITTSTHDEPAPLADVEPVHFKDRLPNKSILKRPPPPTQAQKLNQTIQHGLTTLKRDFLGGIYGTQQPDEVQSTANANGSYARTVTQTNTSANAAAPFWKSALRQWTVPLNQHFEPASSAHAGPTSPISSTGPYIAGLSQPAASSSTLSVDSIKSVRFTMSSLTVVYPLSADSSPADESLTRERVNAEHRKAIIDRIGGKSWTGQALARFYQDCCKSRDEQVNPRIVEVLLQSPDTSPKALDFSNVALSSFHAAEALSDILSVDFGLKRLVLDGCHLDDEGLKAILHGLLVSASLPTLSLANNPRIRAKGWRYLAIFIRKATALRYIDISDNSIDRRTAEWIVQAITPPAHLIPSSNTPADTRSLPLRSVSLPTRSSETSITSMDSISSLRTPLMPSAPLLKELSDGCQANVISIRMENCSLRSHSLDQLAHGVRHSNIKHISLRRNRISPLAAVALAIMMRDYSVPSDTHLSSSGGVASPSVSQSNSMDNVASSAAENHSLIPTVMKNKILPLLPMKHEPVAINGEDHIGLGLGLGSREELRTRLTREIAEQPRIGNLVTLDVKNNDIRHGVNYIAQVLKRNRTLKVLNLSENKVDNVGLCALAEALKFNSCLETLDLSHNPCCGPRLDGVLALRSAFTTNTALMRVFLNATDLNSEGAICLAEYLPELKTVIHLDLTENFEIDIAGVMALSVAVRMNRTLRCLDLNIPSNDPDFSRLSQDILQSCIRNTESAQEELAAKGSKQSVSAPMLKSTVARNLEDRQQKVKAIKERRKEHLGDIIAAGTECRDLLREVYQSVQEDNTKAQDDLFKDILSQARAAQMQLVEAVKLSADSEIKTNATNLNSELLSLCNKASSLVDGNTMPPDLLIPPPLSPDTPSAASPSFSITDSDDDSDEEKPSKTVPSEAQKASRPTLSVDPVNSNSADSQPKSPIESASRFMVLEEGEVFRKKTALDAGNEDDSELDEEGAEVTGEMLRQEILDADVPQRSHTSPSQQPPSPQPSTTDKGKETSTSHPL